MTVGELIKQLADWSPDTKVVVLSKSEVHEYMLLVYSDEDGRLYILLD